MPKCRDFGPEHRFAVDRPFAVARFLHESEAAEYVLARKVLDGHPHQPPDVEFKSDYLVRPFIGFGGALYDGRNSGFADSPHECAGRKVQEDKPVHAFPLGPSESLGREVLVRREKQNLPALAGSADMVEDALQLALACKKGHVHRDEDFPHSVAALHGQIISYWHSLLPDS